MVGASKSGTLAATGSVELGLAASGRVSSWAIEISGTFVGSFAIKGKHAESTSTTYLAKAYKDQSTDAVATAAITSAAVILVDGTGLDIQLDYTHTSGTAEWFASPHVG